MEVPDDTPPEVIDRLVNEMFGAPTAGATEPLPPSFMAREAYRVDKGLALVDSGKVAARARDGLISDEEMFRSVPTRQSRFTPENDARFAADNLSEKFLGATTTLAPYMLDSLRHGSEYASTFGAAAGAAALAAGQLGPQAALPEEVLTVPTAVLAAGSAGMAYGAWRNAYDVEGGLLYYDLRQAGIDRKIAAPVSTAAGAVIGIIEIAQLGQLFNRFLPPGTRYSRRALSKFLTQAMTGEGGRKLAATLGAIGARIAGQTVITTGLELTEEAAQDTVSLAAEAGAHLAQAISDDHGYEPPFTFEEAKAQLQEAITQGLLGFPLLGLPGAAVSSIRTVNQHSRAIAAAQELLGEEATEEVIADLEEEFGLGATVGPLTPQGQQSLTGALADLVEEAGKHRTFQEFAETVSIAVSDEDVRALGFDNQPAMLAAIYERARARKALSAGTPDAGESAAQLDEDASDAVEQIPEEGEPDVSFDFGGNLVKETIAQTTPTLSRLQARLNEIEDAKTRAAMARDVKRQLDEIYRSLRHRVRPFRNGVEAEEFQRVPRVFRNKAGLSLDEMAASLNEQFPSLNLSSADELMDLMHSLVARRKELREIIKMARAQFIRTTEAGRIVRRIRDIESGLKAGHRFGRQEVKAIQTEFITLLDASDLEAEDKAKFLKTITGIQTGTQLEKAMPEIIGRIDRLSEAVERRVLKDRLRRLLETTQPAMVSGKPRGKFTGEIQELLDALRPIVKMSKTQASEALQRSVDAVKDGIPSPMEALRRRALLIQAQGAKAPASDIKTAIREIALAVARGRVANEIVVAGRRARADRIATEMVRIITGGRGITPGVQTFGIRSREERAADAGVRAKIPLMLRSGIEWLAMGWNDLLDTIASKDTGSKPLFKVLSLEEAGLIAQVGDVFTPALAERVAVHERNVQIRQMAHEAYGIDPKDNEALLDVLSHNHQQVSLGTFKNANGVTQDWKLSKDQAIKLWMVMQDPTLDATVRSEHGNALTQEMLDAIGGGVETTGPETVNVTKALRRQGFLSEQDKAWGQAQLDFYQEYYQNVNAVYKKLHLLNLPHNPHYSPIRREGVVQPTSQGFGDLLEEVGLRSTLEGGSFKSRTDNLFPIALSSSTAVLQEHILAMEHFKVWGEKIRDLSAIFKDAEVKQAIVEQYGNKTYSLLLDYLEDFTRGGVHRSKRVRGLDAFRIRFTRAKLAVRPVILVKQLVSFPAFAASIPVDEFVAGVVEFAADPVGKTKILKESDFLKTRAENVDRDIKDVMQNADKREALNAFRKQESFLNALMLNVVIGDQGGIVLGGWPVYRYARKQGKTHEQALEAFARVANRTQQSGDIAEQSAFQRGGSFAKLFSMFGTSPNAYFRLVIGAVRALTNQRAGALEVAKAVAIVQFILPMVFQLVSDGFRWDPDEQKRAAILGPLNGLFVVGDLFDFLLRQALSMRQFSPDVTPVATLGFRDGAKVIDVVGDYLAGNYITTAEGLRALQGLAEIGGVALGGVPLRAGLDAVKAAGRLANGEIKDGLFGLLGWTDFSLQR